MPSIFTPLLRYSSARRTRREDFLTAVLCGVLRKRPNLAVDLISELVQPDCPLVEGQVSITPQSRTERGQPDIWIEAWDQRARRHVLVVENKLGAREGVGSDGTGQIAAYLDELGEQDAATRTLAYITHASAARPAAGRVKHRRWFEIHDWLSQWLKQNDHEALVVELRELMEDWGLDVALTKEDLALAVGWRASIRPRMFNILGYVQGRLRDHVELDPETNWSPIREDDEYIWCRSPKLRGRGGARLEVAFDFAREDDDWSVGRRKVPSAYVAVFGGSSCMPCPTGWVENEEWNDDNYSWTKQIQAFAPDRACAEVYLRFFEESIAELTAALERER